MGIEIGLSLSSAKRGIREDEKGGRKEAFEWVRRGWTKHNIKGGAI
jgi:hypothetical protein